MYFKLLAVALMYKIATTNNVLSHTLRYIAVMHEQIGLEAALYCECAT